LRIRGEERGAIRLSRVRRRKEKTMGVLWKRERWMGRRNRTASIKSQLSRGAGRRRRGAGVEPLARGGERDGGMGAIGGRIPHET